MTTAVEIELSSIGIQLSQISNSKIKKNQRPIQTYNENIAKNVLMWNIFCKL